MRPNRTMEEDMKKLIRQHKVFSFLAMLCVGATLLWAGTLAFDKMELDGNAVDDSPGVAPADFGSLYKTFKGQAGGEVIAGQLAYNFVAEPDVSASLFTGGGSKDISDITAWAWKDGSGGLPDKDNLLNSSAEGVLVNNGGTPELVVYLHADRYATDGSAEMGFWLFQQNVTLGNNKLGGGFGFNGAHEVGDVFVRATFTNGGAVVAITVDTWNGSGLSNLYDSASAKCDGTNLEACGITNAAATAAPWPFQAKNYATANEFPPLTYFEVGLNITQLFADGGATAPACFASFMAETRSSHETTAQLKDFVLGAFPVCKLEVTKACAGSSLIENGTKVLYQWGGTVKNSGAGTVYNATVKDTLPDGSEVIINVSPQTLNAGATGTWALPVGYATTATSGVTNTAVARAGLTSSGSATAIISDPAQATCSRTVNNSIDITKSCTTSLVDAGGTVKVRVDFSGSITNNGQSQISGITLLDFPNAASLNLTSSTLNPGASTTYSGHYFPSTIGTQDGTVPGRYFFSDKVLITNAVPALGGPLPNVSACTTESTTAKGCASASCPICPAGACVVP